MELDENAVVGSETDNQLKTAIEAVKEIAEYLKGAIVVNVPTVTDGSIITGRGPGLVFDFGLAILEHLEGLESAEQVAKDLLLK